MFSGVTWKVAHWWNKWNIQSFKNKKKHSSQYFRILRKKFISSNILGHDNIIIC